MNIIKSSNINIKWQHVPTHSGSISGNEEADRLALCAAKMENTEIQLPGPKANTPSVISTDRIEREKLPTVTQPHIIMIPGKMNDKGNSQNKLTVITVRTTPVRTTTKDRSITKTGQCSIHQYFTAVKMFIFR